MNKLIEVATIIAASLTLIVLLGISLGISLMFLGWIWLGVESVWSFIF